MESWFLWVTPQDTIVLWRSALVLNGLWRVSPVRQMLEIQGSITPREICGPVLILLLLKDNFHMVWFPPFILSYSLKSILC